VEQSAPPSPNPAVAIVRVLISMGAVGFLGYAVGRFVYYHFAFSDRLARLMIFL
jgi:hypothetical protein